MKLNQSLQIAVMIAVVFAVMVGAAQPVLADPPSEVAFIPPPWQAPGDMDSMVEAPDQQARTQTMAAVIEWLLSAVGMGTATSGE